MGSQSRRLILQLPQYIVMAGSLRRNAAFKHIDNKLQSSEDAKDKIYPVLCLRFWCHAHIYSPVFTLILSRMFRASLEDTLLLFALGSLSFAVFDSFGGAYADKKGCKAAIALGIKFMMLLMLGFAAISLFSYKPGSGATILAILCQVLFGIPLALIDGADTVLTRQKAEEVKSLEAEDANRLEGICTKLKYRGLACASFFGCLIYLLVVRAGFPAPAASILFLLTAGGQAVALRQLGWVRNPGGDVQAEPMRPRLRSAAIAIFSDKVLVTWVAIVAAMEGWLLFSTSYFQFSALEDLVKNRLSLAMVVGVPFIYWFLSAIASSGSSYFDRWYQSVKANELQNPFMLLRHGSKLEIPPARLMAAAQIFGVMVMIFVLHFALSAWIPAYATESKGVWSNLAALLFFAAYQFLRGYAQPLLKTTMTNISTARKLKDPTTILSLATASGRLFHAISAVLFSILLKWRVFVGAGSMPLKTRALAATTVIVGLTIGVMNVLCAVALDRKREPVLEPRRDILVVDRLFRSTVIKGAFFVCLAMSNILAPKRSPMGGGLQFNTGAIAYALTFMLVDAIAEAEGKTASRQLWMAGMCSYFVVGLLVVVAVNLPAAVKPIGFDELFTNILRLILASLCSFAVSQYFDIWLFLLLKHVTQGKALWFRNNLSTFFAQMIDTVIFISIGFWDLTFKEQGNLLIGQVGIKWILALLYTPLLYLAVMWIEGRKKLPTPANAP